MVHLGHPGSVKKAREGAKMHIIDGPNPDRVFDGVLDDLGLPQGLLVIFSQCTMRTLESRVEPYAKWSRIYTEAPRHLRHLPTRLLGIIYKFVYTIQRHI